MGWWRVDIYAGWMARKPRIHYPGALFHVILRGNNRQDIFFRPTDRQLWQSILITALERHHWRHPGTTRNLSGLRYAIATEALESGAASIAEIARRLRRSEAAISQLLSRRSTAKRRKC